MKPPTKTTSTTQHRVAQRSTTSTTQPATPAKTPDQLKVIVLNGGAPTGAAAQLRTKLQTVGYTNQPPANSWTGHTQTGQVRDVQDGPGSRGGRALAADRVAGLKVVRVPDPGAAVRAPASTASSSSAVSHGGP